MYIFFAVFLNQTVVLFGFTFATIVYIFLLKISVFLLLLIHNLLITEGILRTKTIAKWDYFSHFKIRGPKKKKGVVWHATAMCSAVKILKYLWNIISIVQQINDVMIYVYLLWKTNIYTIDSYIKFNYTCQTCINLLY